MIRQLATVIVHALLQWAITTLIIINGAAFCVVSAMAEAFHLGPPCVLCARVDRLFSSSSSSSGVSQEGSDRAFHRLLCGAHIAAIAATVSPPLEPEKQQREEEDVSVTKCSASVHLCKESILDSGVTERKDEMEGNHLENLGAMVTHRVVSIGSEICEQDQSEDHRATAAAGDMDGPYVSLFELAPIVALPVDHPEQFQEEDTTTATTIHDSFSGDGFSGEGRPTVGRLIAILRAEQRELRALRAELEDERRAKEEAVELRRQLEEQGELDREAARLAMQLVHEAETARHDLQRQLEAHMVKAQLHESDGDAGDSGGGLRKANGNENYQSLVDFLPGSVYSSSPDLANLLKLYTDGNYSGGEGVHRRDGFGGADFTVVAEEEEEAVAVAVPVTGGSEGNGEVFGGSLEKECSHADLSH